MYEVYCHSALEVEVCKLSKKGMSYFPFLVTIFDLLKDIVNSINYVNTLTKASFTVDWEIFLMAQKDFPTTVMQARPAKRGGSENVETRACPSMKKAAAQGWWCPIWFQHLLVANSYTCHLPIFAHRSRLGFCKKNTPSKGCLGFASCRLTSLLNPPAQARDVCSWQCEQLPNENPWHSMNHEPYWLVHLPGSLVHGLWNMK